MDMNFRQFKHVLMVIALVSSLIANYGIDHSQPRQDGSKYYCKNKSHNPYVSYAISDRMLKLVMILTRPPQRAKTRCSTDQAGWRRANRRRTLWGTLRIRTSQDAAVRCSRRNHCRMLKKAVQQGRSEQRGEAYASVL